MPEVSLERPLGHEKLLAFVLHQDIAGGLEETLGGPLRRELGLLAGLGGAQAGGAFGPVRGAADRPPFAVARRYERFPSSSYLVTSILSYSGSDAPSRK